MNRATHIVRIPCRSLQLRSATLAAVLMLCILGSQWLGWMHRVDHSVLDRQAASVATSGVADVSNAYGSTHSCAAFDAATLADTTDVPLFLPALLFVACLPARFFEPSSQPRHARCPFSSRAPPAA